MLEDKYKKLYNILQHLHILSKDKSKDILQTMQRIQQIQTVSQ